MPTAKINGVTLFHKVHGSSGPWVVTVTGGRNSHLELDDLARAVAHRGYRVIVYDRRNSGRSSLNFETLDPEEEIEVRDLGALLTHLNAVRPFIIGMSRGARIAMKFALTWPDQTRGIGLWGVSGGAATARSLMTYYYGQYLRAAERNGMRGVRSQGIFAALAPEEERAADQLLETDPEVFCAAMRRWRKHFRRGIDDPIIGVSDTELKNIRVPAAILPRYDSWHPPEVAAYAAGLISGSRFLEYRPTVIEGPKRRVDYKNDIPKVADLMVGFIRDLPKERQLSLMRGLRALFSGTRISAWLSGSRPG